MGQLRLYVCKGTTKQGITILARFGTISYSGSLALSAYSLAVSGGLTNHDKLAGAARALGAQSPRCAAKFSSTWYDTLSVLVAKGRAQVGVAASSGDWSKRIRDMQYTDHEDYTMGS